MSHKHSKACTCSDFSKQKKEIVKHGLNVPLVARSAIGIVFLLSLARSTVPERLFKYVTIGDIHIVQHIPSLLYVISILIFVLCLRFALVTTCCIPAIQLRGKALSDIIDQADVSRESRIYAKQMDMARRLSKAIQFKTVSYDAFDTANKTDHFEFLKLHNFLEDQYPLFHQHLEKTVINKYSLIYKWQGSDITQKPYLLTAHQDVVPCPQIERWVHDPFEGVIKDGYIYGRGAIDDKHSVLGYFEAVEDLLKSNFQPIRTVYFAFGHDEEIGGEDGAAHINRYFMEHLGRDCFEFLVDEGLFIIDGAVPGHKRPVAFVCTAEKGCVTVKVSANIEGGHASVPQAESSIGVLSKALKALEDNPLPGDFEGPAENMFASLVSGFSVGLRFLFANSWFFSPLIKLVLLSKPQSASSIRTTTALTVFNAGNKDNVIPPSAHAYVNHRIHPNDSVQKVLEWDRKVINDSRVIVEAMPLSLEPAPVSDSTAPAFITIRNAIHKTYKGACDIAPGLFVANSDTRHYWNIAPNIYRFNPITLHSKEVSMFHGFNERISIENYAQVVQFFQYMILDTDKRSCPIEVKQDKKLD